MAAFVEAGWASSVTKKGGWEEVEDSKQMLELMLSSVDRNTMPSNTIASTGDIRTLDLLGAAARNQLDMNVDCSSSPPLMSDALDIEVAPLPPGWQKCLDLQTGRVYYLQNNNSSSVSQKSSNMLSSSLPSSFGDVCPGHSQTLTIETNTKEAIAAALKRGRMQEEDVSCDQVRRPTADVNIFGVDLNSPPLPKWLVHGKQYACENGKTVLDMTTVGCANCLMFVMLSTIDPRCPNCGSCAVLDFSQPAGKKAKQASMK
ncbi:hypothetical protein L7F22_023511 [Adiantum nelumboides]|nr:hypothetical protein [Adiantum nelumboides]